jgi:hypothetical protein
MPKKDDVNEWADTPIRPMRRSLSSRSVKNLDKKKTVEKALAIPSKEIDEAKKMWSNHHQNSQRQVQQATAANNDGESAPSSRATAA